MRKSSEAFWITVMFIGVVELQKCRRWWDCAICIGFIYAGATLALRAARPAEKEPKG